MNGNLHNPLMSLNHPYEYNENETSGSKDIVTWLCAWNILFVSSKRSFSTGIACSLSLSCVFVLTSWIIHL